ncbi:MAG TPA: zf-HC2 domain-containing protein [Vicinamibacterales bacterium]|jgi:tetratricopeptide (TPR) repeat protein|nr:zf-HC2 domain-containing protein [Vicinamibacterales bacterium]
MDQWTDRLSEYLDDELDARERSELEAHLSQCALCRTILDELRAVVSRAQAVTNRGPDTDLWPGIAQRIAAMGGTRRYAFSLPQLAAAGIALMVLSGGAVWMLRQQTNAPAPPAPQAAVIENVNPALVPIDLADAKYDQAVADLQEALKAGRSRLDPETIKVLEASLASIDQAIEQSQRALAADPANTYLYSHLAAARQRKLALLRRVNALTDIEG